MCVCVCVSLCVYRFMCLCWRVLKRKSSDKSFPMSLVFERKIVASNLTLALFGRDTRLWGYNNNNSKRLFACINICYRRKQQYYCHAISNDNHFYFDLNIIIFVKHAPLHLRIIRLSCSI